MKTNKRVESPWFIKILLSLSGWLGALFLLFSLGGFFMLIIDVDLTEYPLLLINMGAVLLYLIYTAFQKEPHEFLEHFYLALSLIGQSLVILGVGTMFNPHDIDKELYLFIAFFQAFLIWSIPNYIHRMLSSVFMAWALGFFFYELELTSFYLSILTFIVAWLWMNHSSFQNIERVEAIAYGQLIVLIGLTSSFAYSYRVAYVEFDLFKESSNLFFPHSTELTLTLILAYVVGKILQQNHKLQEIKVLLPSLVAIIFLGIISVEVYGLVIAVILLLIGFSLSHKLLMGLGVILSLCFISNYYYFMGETLLDKAMVLAVVGVLMLFSRWSLQKLIGTELENV